MHAVEDEMCLADACKGGFCFAGYGIICDAGGFLLEMSAWNRSVSVVFILLKCWL